MYEPFFSFIEDETGIRVNESHRQFVARYIERRLAEKGLALAQYLALVRSDTSERAALIDEAAINETYFFREEAQFAFLRDNVFRRQSDGAASDGAALGGAAGEAGFGTTAGKAKPAPARPLVLWSAACSSGEEALSAYALAKSCGVSLEVYATDIDTKALEQLRGGRYNEHSFRKNEREYWPLLDGIGERTEGGLVVSPETLSHFHVAPFNLVQDIALPVPAGGVDIIFLRNVFIYFSPQTQLAVLARLADALTEGGYLFLSVNEIAAVDVSESLPFVKKHEGSVYYLQKDSARTRPVAAGRGGRTAAHVAGGVAGAAGVAPATVVSASQAYAVPAKAVPAPASAVPASQAYAASTKAVPIERLVEMREKAAPAVPSATANTMTLAELWKTVADAATALDLEKARNILSSYTFKPTEFEYQFTLQAAIAVQEGNLTEAATLFEKASIVNPRFWPAYFQLGLVYHKMNDQKRMTAAFNRCMSLLESVSEADWQKNRFLTASFSPSYFLDICNSHLAAGAGGSGNPPIRTV